MKKLSLWAREHKQAARFIIVISFIVLNILGVVTGKLFTALGISIPASVMLLFAVAYCAGFIFYPSKSLKGKKLNASAFYVRQKSCDFILAGSTFCMIVYLGNHPDRLFQYIPNLNAATAVNSSLPSDSAVKTYKSIAEFSASMKDENGNHLKWKERKKLLKEQVRAIKSSGLPSEGKAGLIILSVIAALFLLALVLGLACNLSCSGSDAAAVVVGLGGTALIIFLLVVVIRSIKGKKKKIKEPEKESSGT